MSDIFVSYKREEHATARKLADALEDEGWIVWWDPKLRAGEHFDDVIEAALKDSKCVVVVWSKLSSNSRYVRDEATYALNHKKLVPVAIEEVELPFRFAGLHTPRLIDWEGSRSAPDFRKLVNDISAVLGEPSNVHQMNEEAERKAKQDRLREQERERILEEEKRRVAAEAERQRIEEENRRKPSRFFQELLLSVNNPATYALGALVVMLVVGSIVWRLNWKQSEAPTKPTEEQTSRTNQSTPDTPQKPTELTTGVTGKSEAARPTEGKPLPEPAAPKPAMAAGKVFRDRLKSGGEGPEMIVLPAGNFQMGDLQGKGNTNEVPVHTVQIGRLFALGRYEVTFDDYDRFAKFTNRELPGDEGWGRGRLPVISVSWEDAKAYVHWLSEQTQKRYRLPTEAEWEYAARSGGKDTAWSGTSSDVDLAEFAWYAGNSKGKTQEVGTRKATWLGLHDMSGNVSEWVEDCWHENYKGAPGNGGAWLQESEGLCRQRVIRGGSWFNTPGPLRSSYRSSNLALYRIIYVGFRLAQDLN